MVAFFHLVKFFIYKQKTGDTYFYIFIIKIKRNICFILFPPFSLVSIHSPFRCRLLPLVAAKLTQSSNSTGCMLKIIWTIQTRTSRPPPIDWPTSTKFGESTFIDSLAQPGYPRSTNLWQTFLSRTQCETITNLQWKLPTQQNYKYSLLQHSPRSLWLFPLSILWHLNWNKPI